MNPDQLHKERLKPKRRDANPESPTLSAELYIIPVEANYLVYAPLRQAAFLTNGNVVNVLVDLQDGKWDESVSGSDDLAEFLRALEILEGGEEKKPLTTFTGAPKPTGVTLFLTTACNLRCTYCYAAAGDTPVKVMLPDIAKQGIDFVIGNAVEIGAPSISVTYHGGGEPTVNWSALTESFRYATERAHAENLEVYATLATNGVIPDYKIDWILEHLDGVSLSFDGLPEVHDAHRVTPSGKGSSGDVIRTILRFDEADFNYGLRLTITREHIPQMEASVRYLCENFNPSRIQVEPAYQLGRWRDAPSAETAGFIEGFRAAQAVAQSFGRQIEFSGARVGTLSNHFCGITQDSFCLTSEGEVSACYETFIKENEHSGTFFYGKYDPTTKGYQFDLTTLDRLRRQTVENRDFCSGCFAKWNCGGDCYHKSLAVNGTEEFTGTDRCHIIRELTKDQILERIAQSNGLIWHEARTDFAQAGNE